MTDKTYKIDSDTMRQVLDCIVHRDALLELRLFNEMQKVARMVEVNVYRDDAENWGRWFDDLRTDIWHLLTPGQKQKFNASEQKVSDCSDALFDARRLDSKLRGML